MLRNGFCAFLYPMLYTSNVRTIFFIWKGHFFSSRNTPPLLIFVVWTDINIQLFLHMFTGMNSREVNYNKHRWHVSCMLLCVSFSSLVWTKVIKPLKIQGASVDLVSQVFGIMLLKPFKANYYKAILEDKQLWFSMDPQIKFKTAWYENMPDFTLLLQWEQ